MIYHSLTKTKEEKKRNITVSRGKAAAGVSQPLPASNEKLEIV